MIERQSSPSERMQLNADAWWRFHALIVSPAPIKCPYHFWCRPDRIWYEKSPGLLSHIAKLVSKKILRTAGAGNHGVDVEVGYREDTGQRGGVAAQIVVHQFFIEFDFDMANPTRDLWSAIRHLGEVIHPCKTDPFQVAEGLRKRGMLA